MHNEYDNDEILEEDLKKHLDSQYEVNHFLTEILKKMTHLDWQLRSTSTSLLQEIKNFLTTNECKGIDK